MYVLRETPGRNFWNQVYDQRSPASTDGIPKEYAPATDILVQFEHDLEAEFAEEKEDAERRTRMDTVIAKRAKP